MTNVKASFSVEGFFAFKGFSCDCLSLSSTMLIITLQQIPLQYYYWTLENTLPDLDMISVMKQ